MTLDITFDTRGLEALERRVGNIDDVVNAEMLNTMHASLTLAEQVIVNTISEKDLVYTGALRSSIYQEVFGKPPDFYGFTGTGIIYGRQLDEGRPPGIMPPVAALDLWAKRKGIPVPGYVIARAIYRRGIKARHFIRDSFEKAQGPIQHLWDTMLDRVIARLK